MRELNHSKNPLRAANKDRKAIKLAAMLSTSCTALHAPDEAASIIFLLSLLTLVKLNRLSSVKI